MLLFGIGLPLLLLGVVLSFYSGFSVLLCQKLFCSLKPNVCVAEDGQPTFAKAKSNCTLFLSPEISNTNPENILFCVPTGYFVRLLDTTAQTVYKVAYADRIGYISATAVKMVSIEPQQQYLSPIAIKTKQSGGSILRATPSTSSEMVALVPAESEIKYIASTTGEKPSDGQSNEWYFVQYFPASEPTAYYEGYLYSERVLQAPQIPVNTEDDPITPLPLDIEEESAPKRPTPTWLKGLLVTVLCFPALLFAIYLATTITKQKKLARD